MQLVKSSKCYFSKFITKQKQEHINKVLEEYSRVVNAFIGKYQWQISNKKTKQNKKTCFDLCYAEHINSIDTWLSARLVKNAFREGYGMIQSAKSNATTREEHYRRPTHTGKKMILSETIATTEFNPKTKEFDLLVSLGSIGNKIKIVIPLKKNKHFNKFGEDKDWKISKSVTVSEKYIQFSFSTNIKKVNINKTENTLRKTFKDKHQKMKDKLSSLAVGSDAHLKQRDKIEKFLDDTIRTHKILGLDCGINKLLASDKREEFGLGYKSLLEKLLRKKQGSKAWYKCKEEIREFIDYHVKNLDYNLYNLIVVEKLDNIHYKMKVKHRLTKNMRRLISKWTFRYVYKRLFSCCDTNRIRYRQVSSFYNSQTCPLCSHTNQKNRETQSEFCCQDCGYSDNADYSASKQAIVRYLSWKPTVSNSKQLNNKQAVEVCLV